MKNIRIFLSENFQFSVIKFPVYLNRYVFVMKPYNVKKGSLSHKRTAKAYAFVFVHTAQGLRCPFTILCDTVEYITKKSLFKYIENFTTKK